MEEEEKKKIFVLLLVDKTKRNKFEKKLNN